MSEFHGYLELRQLGHRRWLTLAPLSYSSDVADRVITVPAEFITDLASVPRLPLAYMLAGDRARGPALIHDWLYQHPDWDDRELADRIFYEAIGVHQPDLGHEAESWITRAIMYGGVRAGGWAAWSGHDKRATTLNPEWTTQAAWPVPVESP